MYCGLTELPSFLPPYLRRLNCIGNNITKLPPLPPSIEKMRLVGNPIKVLPVSIGNLDLGKELYDRNNLLIMMIKVIFREISQWVNIKRKTLIEIHLTQQVH